MRWLLAGRRVDECAERVLFALVANRALAPSSKLAAAGWVNEDAVIDGLPETSDDACYRAMDWLNEITPALEREVYARVADLLNLEVDLLFFDTTSTYFEVEEPDAPIARDESGLPLPEPDSDSDSDRWPGSGPTATPRITGRTCPRWWAAWRSPAPGSRSECGAGRVTPPTPPSSGRSRTIYGTGCWTGSCGSPTAASRRRPSGATCNAAPTTTSWVRSCAQARRRQLRHRLGKAATSTSPTTCRSKRFACPPSTTASWSATTPRPADRDRATRERLVAGLLDQLPRAGWYVMVDISHTGCSSVEFSERLLVEQEVLIVPGTVFAVPGAAYPHQVRVAFCGDRDTAIEGMRRLIQLATEFRDTGP